MTLGHLIGIMQKNRENFSKIVYRRKIKVRRGMPSLALINATLWRSSRKTEGGRIRPPRGLRVKQGCKVDEFQATPTPIATPA